MGYDWEQHKADCHRLYVESSLSLEEVMRWLKAERGFAPRYVYSPPYSHSAMMGYGTS